MGQSMASFGAVSGFPAAVAEINKFFGAGRGCHGRVTPSARCADDFPQYLEGMALTVSKGSMLRALHGAVFVHIMPVVVRRYDAIVGAGGACSEGDSSCRTAV